MAYFNIQKLLNHFIAPFIAVQLSGINNKFLHPGTNLKSVLALTKWILIANAYVAQGREVFFYAYPLEQTLCSFLKPLALIPARVPQISSRNHKNYQACLVT